MTLPEDGLSLSLAGVGKLLARLANSVNNKNRTRSGGHFDRYWMCELRSFGLTKDANAGYRAGAARACIYALLIGLQSNAAMSQSAGTGAPSTTPQVAPDVRGTIAAARRGGNASIDLQKMVIASKLHYDVNSMLKRYLTINGVTPVAGTTHIFNVRVLANDSVAREIRDFQYLTAGKNAEDALRESFTHENAPGTEDVLESVPNGLKLLHVYFTAQAVDGKFEIRIQDYSPEYYERIRREGLDLRDERVGNAIQRGSGKSNLQQRLKDAADSESVGVLQYGKESREAIEADRKAAERREKKEQQDRYERSQSPPPQPPAEEGSPPSRKAEKSQAEKPKDKPTATPTAPKKTPPQEQRRAPPPDTQQEPVSVPGPT